MRPIQSATICRAILSGSLCKPIISAVGFPSSFSFSPPNRLIRYFPAKPRFDFREIHDPDNAVKRFREMVRSNPLRSVVQFNKLLSAVVKMKGNSVALPLFDEMLQRSGYLHVEDKDGLVFNMVKKPVPKNIF